MKPYFNCLLSSLFTKVGRTIEKSPYGGCASPGPPLLLLSPGILEEKVSHQPLVMVCALLLKACLLSEFRLHQFGTDPAAVTNNPQVSMASNSKDLLLDHAKCPLSGD